MPVFLDTNVFLFAAGREHPLRAGCREVLSRVAEGELEATTSTEVVQEVLHVLCRRGLNDRAVRLAEHILDLFPQILPVRAADMRMACSLLDEVPSISVRDAVHAGTMLANGLDRIVSADVHFDRVPGIERITPV